MKNIINSGLYVGTLGFILTGCEFDSDDDYANDQCVPKFDALIERIASIHAAYAGNDAAEEARANLQGQRYLSVGDLVNELLRALSLKDISLRNLHWDIPKLKYSDGKHAKALRCHKLEILIPKIITSYIRFLIFDWQTESNIELLRYSTDPQKKTAELQALEGFKNEFAKNKQNKNISDLLRERALFIVVENIDKACSLRPEIKTWLRPSVYANAIVSEDFLCETRKGKKKIKHLFDANKSKLWLQVDGSFIDQFDAKACSPLFLPSDGKGRKRIRQVSSYIGRMAPIMRTLHRKKLDKYKSHRYRADFLDVIGYCWMTKFRKASFKNHIFWRNQLNRFLRITNLLLKMNPEAMRTHFNRKNPESLLALQLIMEFKDEFIKKFPEAMCEFWFESHQEYNFKKLKLIMFEYADKYRGYWRTKAAEKYGRPF